MATPNRTKGSSEKAGQDRGRDFENVGVEIRSRGKYELHNAQETTQEESDGHIYWASAESEWPNTHAGEPVYYHAEPRTIIILLGYDFVKTLHCLLDTYRIVNHLFVHLMGIAKFSKIDALCRTDYLDLCCMRRLVVKGDDHAARDVKELTVNFQDPR